MPKRTESAYDALGAKPGGGKRCAFVDALLADPEFRIGEAARTAGYSPNSAKTTGWKLMKRADVRAALAERIRDRAKRSGVEAQQDEVLRHLHALATSDLRQAAEWKPGTIKLFDSTELPDAAAYAVQEVSMGPHGPKIKLHPKGMALEKLMAHLGLVTQRAEVTIHQVQATMEQMAAVVDRVLEAEISDPEARTRIGEAINEGWEAIGR